MIAHVSNVHLDMGSHQMRDGLCCFRNSYAFYTTSGPVGVLQQSVCLKWTGVRGQYLHIAIAVVLLLTKHLASS